MPHNTATADAPAGLCPKAACASARGPAPRPGPASGRTRADVDLAERLLAAANAGADVRREKVRRVKAAIGEHAYENDLKFQVALERLCAGLREDAALPHRPAAG